MRAELMPPEVAHELETILESVYRRLERGAAPTEVAAWVSAESGYRIDEESLHGFFGSVDPVEAAWAIRVAADPSLVRAVVPTRDELVEVVRRLMPTDACWDPDRAPWWAALLEAHIPRPGASTLVSYPPDGVDPHTWDAEAIVAYAVAHRPITL